MLVAHLLSLAVASPLTPLSGGGSMYVFAQLGPSGDPICQDWQTTYFEVEDLLAGIGDEIVCVDGPMDATSFASGRIDLRDDGFTAEVNGWGEAVAQDVNAFSRHDINASITLAVEDDLRIRVNWFYLAAGLGNVWFQIHRLGDINGPDQPSPPILEHIVSSYIDPITENGVDVLRMPAGRWRIFFVTTHQSFASTEGFNHSFARTTNTATFVPIGDVDGDGLVNVTDLLALLEQYGSCNDCLADLDGDGVVEVNDLLMLLADWSP